MNELKVSLWWTLCIFKVVFIFKAGELVILEKRVDTDWILGKVDEREGMFPQDFVKVKMPFPGEVTMETKSLV